MNLSKKDIKRIKKAFTKSKFSLIGLIIIILSVFALLFEDFINFEQNEAEKDFCDYPFSVSFIDVGQGDCSLISCNGINILVDGGESQYAKDVLNYLKKNNIKKIDCYILSHPHSDHVGAAATIMRSIECDKVFTTYFSEFNVPTSYMYENIVDTIYEYTNEAIAVEAGDSYKFGDLEISIAAPISESDDYNEMSIVFTASYKDASVLFTGDTTAAVEKQILNNKLNVDADVIKIAHHGSTSSSSSEFIDAVSPDIAIISCGKNNSYGHPHKEIIKLLNDNEIDYYRTDINGTVVYYGDGNTMNIGVSK